VGVKEIASRVGEDAVHKWGQRHADSATNIFRDPRQSGGYRGCTRDHPKARGGVRRTHEPNDATHFWTESLDPALGRSEVQKTFITLGHHAELSLLSSGHSPLRDSFSTETRVVM